MRGRHRAAVTVFFAISGVAFASLFSRMPDLQREHRMSDGTLGLVLLAGALALMITQPLAGARAARSGSAPPTVAGGLAYAVGLVLPGLASSPVLFGASIVALGAASGVLDVSMNAQAVAVNKRHRREIFASFHAAFSFGALAGAGVGGLAAGVGLRPLAHMTIVATALVVTIFLVRAGLLPATADARADARMFARPTRALAALGVLSFCALLAEGSVGDWSAILLDRETEAGPSLAALGLAAFSLTMGFGRLAADPLAERFGAPAVVRAGGLVAAGGLALALAGGSAAAGIAGFAVMGCGLAGLFPLALNAAAAGDHAAAPALAAVSTTGYVGFIAGPAIIGLLSDATSLPTALALVGVLCVAAAVLAGATGRTADHVVQRCDT
ncbi:MAG TPA: MFS transporter [Solirubrobacteraceae bacterium]|nr:MFS transporter [Solirubrobacteraceae bacterium]